ncbi:glycosyltransferase family 39 protein [Actinomadura sp. DC4]|uniref:ArnT family glycosyltransferase n=1 Tax=Actinomadura sp. DC4 TaxID=3055069 RepID=UPI0025B0CF0E|nr:glycosyltransferase family 39 protein [Actinomadura sp. DC4]MDN3354684.1 glycosyltransferase family 39 protein [Actinomadura sp. DC4]
MRAVERTARQQAASGLAGFAAVPVTIVVAVVAAVLTALSSRYGFHRDELYFLVAGAHPAWGYVDQPPLTPLVARAATAVFGHTPAGLRVVSTLACAATVYVVALVARELGGGRRAQVLAALATAASGFVLAVGHMVSTATFDLLAWVVVAWLALRLLRTGDGRWWLALGAAVGLATLNKYLVGLLAVALVVAVLVAGPRGVLRGLWPVAGVAVALLVAGPDLWWQATHGWPQLTVAGGISSDDGAENRVLFVPMQIAYLSPLFVPVWIAGIRHLWRDLPWARSPALAYPVLCVLVLAAGGKSYYALPLLLVLTAAGCEPLARWTRGRWRTTVVAVAGVVAAAMSVLITLPVLPADSLSVVNGINAEQGEQVGWPAFTSAVAARWSAIPAASRPHAVIFTENYGEDGALARYGPAYGLPAPYSGHMSNAGWGPPPDSANGPVLLVYQDGDREIGRHFTGCREVGRVNTGRDVDNQEQGARITLCAGTAKPWSALWPDLRHYY